jgi:hypothetical protein
VFAEQKDRMGLFIRTIGIARATTTIGMANLVYNIKRFSLDRSPFRLHRPMGGYRCGCLLGPSFAFFLRKIAVA